MFLLHIETFVFNIDNGIVMCQKMMCDVAFDEACGGTHCILTFTCPHHVFECGNSVLDLGTAMMKVETKKARTINHRCSKGPK